MRVNYIEKFTGIRGVPLPNDSDQDFVEITNEVKFLYWLQRVAAWTVNLDCTRFGINTVYNGIINDGEFRIGSTVERQTYLNEAHKTVPVSTNLQDAFGLDDANQINLLFGQSCVVNTLTPSYKIYFELFALLFDLPAELSQNPLGLTPSAVVASFDGVPINLYDNTAGDLTGFFSVTPSAWWPYTRPDGSFPIWNAGSGANIIPKDDPEFIRFVGVV